MPERSVAMTPQLVLQAVEIRFILAQTVAGGSKEILSPLAKKR
jgi:hypothetical protein